MIVCKFCRSDKLVKRRKEPHIGIYCVACGKWQQWVSPGSPKEREVPWEVTGKSLKQLVIDDPIPNFEPPKVLIVDDPNAFSNQLSPKTLEKIIKHSYFDISSITREEFDAVMKARFPTKADITIFSSGMTYPITKKPVEPEDNTPPWKED